MSHAGAIPLGRLCGVAVRVHYTFLLVLAVLSLQTFQELGLAGTAWFTSRVGLLFLCFLVHELGHALAARALGVRVFDILLGPLGGMARLERLPEDPSVELRIAAAGPLANAAFLVAFVPLRVAFAGAELPVGGVREWSALDFSLAVNALMAAINLVPAFPMDGGRVLRALVSRRVARPRATRIAVLCGRGLALAAIASPVLGPRWLAVALVGVFVWAAGGRELDVLRREEAEGAARAESEGTRPDHDPARSSPRDGLDPEVRT